MADRNIGIDKDWLYLYVCGLEVKDPSLHDRQLELIRELVSVPASDHLIYRATMRAGYCNNYPFTSFSIYGDGELQRYFGMAYPEKDFPEFLSSSLWWGIALSGGVLGLLCLTLVFWTARDALMLATLGAIALAALFYLFLPPPNLSWMLHHAPPTRIVSLPNTLGLGLYSWLNPTAAYSPFSVFPRCLCGMLALAAFTLRWSGRHGAAYWAPLIVCFVHQSEAPILLAVMICCDLAVRPLSLVRLASALPISLTVVVIALRERMLSIMGFSWFIVAVILALVVVLGALVLVVPSFRSAIKSGWTFIDDWREQALGGFPFRSRRPS